MLGDWPEHSKNTLYHATLTHFPKRLLSESKVGSAFKMCLTTGRKAIAEMIIDAKIERARMMGNSLLVFEHLLRTEGLFLPYK